ncbi:MAG: HAMP domain-containing sensor histidine kinase [Gemmatimonadota bacterium]
MPTSHLRVRLAAGFALAFGVGLSLLAMGALGYLWRESHRRLDAHLAAVANGVAEAMLRELRETPDSSMAYAASEVRLEWPVPTDRWVIASADFRVLSATDSAALTMRMVSASRTAGTPHFTLTVGEGDLEAMTEVTPRAPDAGHDWEYRVIAWSSTEGIEQDIAWLASILAVATPLLILFSLGAGYLLASRALQPARDLGTAIAALASDALSHRLPTGGADDEIGTLAREFNRLLERLEVSQERNQRFVREAAHQIRTPLTLVLGEAEVERNHADLDPVRARAAIQRIQTAATVMRHRVDELMLLAEAQAGTRPRLEEVVELDGLALECTDLMRARAASLGRTLALGTVVPVAVRGNSQLLREALLELLENGCRHAGSAASVTTEVLAIGDDRATISVSSVCDASAPTDSQGSGLGIQIVHWIAGVHGGVFKVHASATKHVAQLTLPVLPQTG